jgi:hypothetical protein
VGSGAPEELLAAWRWQTPLWTQGDREAWRAKMVEGWEGFLSVNEHIRDRLAPGATKP